MQAVGREDTLDGLKSPAAGLPHGLTSWDLCIDKKNIGDEGVIALIDAVTKLPKIWHALSFNSERVSDSAGKALNLDLFNAKVGDDNLKSLAGKLPSGLAKLDLNIEHKNFGDVGMLTLFDQIMALSNDLWAWNLGLSNTKVGNDGLKSSD